MCSLFCAPASAEVCPSFVEVIQNLFKGTLASYQASVEPFSPNEDMKKAGAQLKTLVDTLSPEAKDSVLKLQVHGSSRRGSVVNNSD